MGDQELRPGFNLESTFKGHLSAVRGVLRNPNNGHFVSYDDKSLKAWVVDRDGSTAVMHNVTFPAYQSTFVTAMVLGSNINMLFAACLDGNLRTYNERLSLKSCMPWHNGLVRELVYNTKRREVISAGSCGVKVRPTRACTLCMETAMSSTAGLSLGRSLSLPLPSQVWECEMDQERYKDSKDLNPFDIPRDKDGEVRGPPKSPACSPPITTA